MSRKKLRVHRTDTGNLVSNLRGEVGEIVTSWVLMRRLIVQANSIRSGDLDKDMKNDALQTLDVLTSKLEDEVIARLSELADTKIGRLNFHFANQKLGGLDDEVDAFRRFVKKKRFHEKRNYNISHKELPEKWTDHKEIPISYRDVVRGVAMAQRLMKRIDREWLGPSAPYLWREMRKRRHAPMHPARASYLLLPYLALSPEDRLAIAKEEEAEGKEVWTEMKTMVNGEQSTVLVARDWGIVRASETHVLVLDGYPIQTLRSIEIEDSDSHASADASEIVNPPDDA